MSRQSNTPANVVQTLDKLQERLKTLHNSNMNWRTISALPEFRLPSGEPIAPGTLCSIAKGRDPKNPHVRAVLHLPALIPAPACRVCGEVHTTKRCTRRKLTDYEMLSDLAEMGMM